jgi:heavy metal sensor kinase
MIIKSYRLKLALIHTVSVLALFLAVSAIVYYRHSQGLLTAVDDDLLRGAKTAAATGAPESMLSDDMEKDIIKKFDDEFYQIISNRGKVVMTTLGNDMHWPVNKSLMLDAFRGVTRYETIQYRAESFRTLYYPLGDDRILRVGEGTGSLDRDTEMMRYLLMVLLPFVVVVSFIMSWFLAGRSLSPVVKIRSLAAEIIQGRFDRRIDIGIKGKEIDDLVLVLNNMLDSLERFVEAQKRFTSDVAHEIRSPLTALRGSIEVALRKKRSHEDYEDLLRDNLADVIRLSRITDNLLLLTRADNNILELRREWVDVSRLVENIVEKQRGRARSSGVSLEELYTDNLRTVGDGDLLEQAFTNILENAIKYTPSEGTVTIKTSGDEQDVYVCIGDTGIGIPEGDIPRIFERFYRVDEDRSRRAGGTGLGLAITQWIISAHHGKIIVKSTPGEGSEFTVVLPKDER